MKNNKAFTLIELLVVVLIIGILAAVALPQYRRAVDKTRISTLVNTMRSIKSAQQRYYLANGVYADTEEALDLSFREMPYRIFLRYSDNDSLYIYAQDYFPGILLIAYYQNTTASCYADSNNKRAMDACQHLCMSTSLYKDGSWKTCSFY